MWTGWTAAAPAAPMPTVAPPPLPAASTTATQPPLPAVPPSTNAANVVAAPPIAATVAPAVPAAVMAPVAAVPDASNPYSPYTAAQYAAMTPEQQYALQQHWQQWQTYQQEYAKWHAQYGEQYKREMAAAASTTAVPQPATGNYANFYQTQPPPPPPDNSGQAGSAGSATKISGHPQMYAAPPPMAQPPPPITAPPPNAEPPSAAAASLATGPPPMLGPRQNTAYGGPQFTQPPPNFGMPNQPMNNRNEQDAFKMNSNAPPPQPQMPNQYQYQQQHHQQKPQQPPNSDFSRNRYGPPNEPPFGSNNYRGNDQNQSDNGDYGKWQNDRFSGNNYNNDNSNNNNNFNRNRFNNDGNGPNNYRNNYNDGPGNSRNNNNFPNNDRNNDMGNRYGRNTNMPPNYNDGPNNRPGGGGNSNYNTGPPNDQNRNWSNNQQSDWGPNNNNDRNNRTNNFGPYNNNFNPNNNCGPSGPGPSNNNNKNWNDNNGPGWGNQQQRQQQSQNYCNDRGQEPPQQQQRPNPRASELDEESFDRQFRQWEQQFEDWKKANVNHPDREMYRRYEQEFENQRKRIMERREQMRRRKMEQMGASGTQAEQNAQSKPPPLQPPPFFSQMQASNDSWRQDDDESKPNTEDASYNSPEHLVEDENLEDEVEKKEEPEAEPESEPELEPVEQEPGPKPQSSKDNFHVDVAVQNKSVEPEPVDKTEDAPKILKNQRVGKRKSRFDAPKAGKPPAAVINLDADEEDASDVQRDEPISSFFAKSEGIPGLDLVGSEGKTKDFSSGTEDYNRAEKERQEESGPTRPPKMPNIGIFNSPFNNSNQTSMPTVTSESPSKKIPSLFDIVIEKPTGLDENILSELPMASPSAESHHSQEDSSKLIQNLQTTVPNIANMLQDSDFMQKVNDALAKAQGKDKPDPGAQPPLKFLEQLPNLVQQFIDHKNAPDNVDDRGEPLSFSEWQQKRGYNTAFSGPNPDDDSSFKDDNYDDGNYSNDRSGPDFNDRGFDRGGNNNNNGPRNNQNFDDRNFGNRNFGPNGPNFNDSFRQNFGNRNFGPNGPNFAGPGNPNSDFDFRGNFNGPNGPYGSTGPNGPNGSNNFFGPPNNNNFGNRFGGPPNSNFRGGPQNFGNNGRNNFGGNKNFGGGGPGFASNFNNSGNSNSGGNNWNESFQNDNSNDGNPRKGNNPFRKNDGTPAPLFDDSNDSNMNNRGGGGGGRGGRSLSGGRNSNRGRSSSGGRDDTKKPWVTGPEGNLGNNDDYYRPMQIIDYQNSLTIAPKVIDYGHGGNPTPNTFQPFKTFDYGHSSSSKPVMPTNVDNNKIFSKKSKNRRKNKKNKNKNANNANKPQGEAQDEQQKKFKDQQGQNNDSQSQLPPKTKSNCDDDEIVKNIENNPSFYPENREIKEQDESEREKESANEAQQAEFENNNKAPEDLEEISDTEDNLCDDMDLANDEDDDDSLAPPPPPMFSSNEFYTYPNNYRGYEKTHSIFPSTATANQKPEQSTATKLTQMSIPTVENQNTIPIDEILLRPGRLTRPRKICMILRGPPGSGKSYVAKLIKEKEKELGGNTPRILSIDDYFLVENDYDEKCPKTGKKISRKEMIYEFEKEMEEVYMKCLMKQFKKTVSDNLYDFIIVDCNNNSLRTLNEFYCHSKASGFMPYIIDLICDSEICLSRNIHNRTASDIKEVIDSWKATPFHYIKLDVSSLLENVVEMEDVENIFTDDVKSVESVQKIDEEDSNSKHEKNDEIAEEDSNEATDDPLGHCGFLKSKWENEVSSDNLARLDGTSKPLVKRATMEDFLQLDDWEPPKTSANGKKRVRWADIEERRAQEKMRAIGFVVGQTDWNRMMDPNAGNRALNRTKYIERVKRNK